MALVYIMTIVLLKILYNVVFMQKILLKIAADISKISEISYLTLPLYFLMHFQKKFIALCNSV